MPCVCMYVLRIDRTLAHEGTGVSEEDVPSEKKKSNFPSQFAQFCAFFLPEAPTKVRQLVSAKIEVLCLHPL